MCVVSGIESRRWLNSPLEQDGHAVEFAVEKDDP